MIENIEHAAEATESKASLNITRFPNFTAEMFFILDISRRGARAQSKFEHHAITKFQWPSFSSIWTSEPRGTLGKERDKKVGAVQRPQSTTPPFQISSRDESSFAVPLAHVV